MRLTRLIVLITAILMTRGFARADEPASGTPEESSAKGEVLQKAEALEGQAEKIEDAEQQSRQAAAAARQKLLELEQSILAITRKLEQSQKAISEQEKALKEQQEAQAKAEAARKASQAAVDAANKALAEAQKKLEEAKKAADASTAKAKETAATVSATSSALAEMRNKMTELAGSVEASTKQLAMVKSDLEQAAAAAAKAREQRIALLKEAEQLREQAGEWVSFAGEVAPILYKRCLACHNARTAKGRYNMESYASILKGGESGAAIEPGDAEFSNLCILVEDGSMPKDADPLTAEQVSLIKEWVSLGARLDAGKDENVPLIKIMPKFPQPQPPEKYPVAIPVTALAFSPDGKTLASSGYHEVILWSVAEGTVVRRITNVAERVYDLDFNPDGSKIAVAAGTPGQFGEVKIFNTAEGALLADLVTVEDAMFGVAFNQDGTRLAACGADRSVRLFDVSASQETVLIEDHADWVLDVAWSPDGTKLVSASRDKTAKVFDAGSGDALVTFNGHGEVVTAAAVLSDGKRAVTCGRDKRVRIWTLEDGKEAKAIGGFGDEITQLKVLADDRILTACADRKARSHKSDGTALKTYDGHQDWIYSIAADSKADRVATGSYDGEIRLWSLEEGKNLSTWKAAPGLAGREQAAK